MPQIFVFTAGNPEARSHLDDSIRNPIDPNRVREHVPAERTQEFQTILEDVGGYFAWGAQSGPQNVGNWQKMEPGDWVLCVYASTYHYVARVSATLHSAELAAEVWGRDGKGNTWEYMYFLTKPQPTATPLDRVDRYLWKRYMGFSRIKDEDVATIENDFGTLEDFIRRRILEEDVDGEPEENFLKILEAYHEENVHFESASRGRRYRVASVGGDGADIERVDGGETERVTAEAYARVRQSLERGESIQLGGIPGNRIQGATVVQGYDLSLKGDRDTVARIVTDEEAGAVLLDLVDSLRVDQIEEGERPYKPAVLLGALRGVEEGRITTNHIEFDEIVPEFLNVMERLDITAGEEQAAGAFSNLSGDILWLLAYNPDQAPIRVSAPSPAQIRERVSHARLKDRYWDLLQKTEWRSRLLDKLEQRLFGVGPPPPPEEGLAMQTVVEDFAQKVRDAQLRFGRGSAHVDLVRAFVVSLATKGFAILTGLSGSGKTQIALRFGEWLGPDRHLLVPVRPDWTSPEALLGYEDALQQPDDGGRRVWKVPEALHFMLRAHANPDNPYLLILDEMNLAHVERYFADILSGMESNEPTLPNLTCVDGRWCHRGDGPDRILVPKNLFVVGTVNVDETTYMFSPKVLDRANTFEFRVAAETLDPELRKPSSCEEAADGLATAFLEISRNREAHVEEPHSDVEDLVEQLRRLHRLLSPEGFEFGHRVFFEALRFASLLERAGEGDWRRALDLQVMQKILPRLHGARRRIEPVLTRLGTVCHDLSAEVNPSSNPDFDPAAHEAENADLPVSFDKVRRMTHLVRANQFVSFTD